MRQLRVFAILAMLALCAACGGSPEKQVQNVASEYMHALFSKDIDKVMKLVYMPEQINVLGVNDKMIKDLLKLVLDQLPDDMAKNVKIETLDPVINGDKAQVSVRLTGNGQTLEDKLHLVNVDGWKVVPNL